MRCIAFAHARRSLHADVPPAGSTDGNRRAELLGFTHIAQHQTADNAHSCWAEVASPRYTSIRANLNGKENIMPIRTAEAVWDGGFPRGEGKMKLGSGMFEGRYSFTTRMQDEPGTNPEEMLAAAHAGCFSMALSAGLTRAGHEPQSIHTRAQVHLDKVGEGFQITHIDLETEAQVAGVDEQAFQQHAEKAKTNCIISKALGGTSISLNAQLKPVQEFVGAP